MNIQRIDHVGIIVNDLPAMTAFFLDFGLEMLGEGQVKGAWAKRMEKMIGLQNIQKEVAMPPTVEVVVLGAPGGETNVELVKIHTPANENGIQPPVANTYGIQHIAFAVEDIEALVANMTKKDAELIGDIHNYEDAYKLCFIRGPEGVVLELAEKIK